MLVALVMGFCAGLPLLLTMGVLQAWMKERSIDLTWIGMISLVQLPYTWKFIWAPVLDRFTPPFLGRRRGWLLIAQLLLITSIVALGYSDPVENAVMMVVAAILVAFFSATQDIVIDAYRREDLADEELGLGSSMYIYGYRLGMLLAGGGGLIMADHMPFSRVYLIMASCMLPGVLTTLLTPEPEVTAGAPRTMKEAVVNPLVEYFSRHNAIWMLIFILLYKIGDTMASAITTPFYLDIGFTKTDIGAVVKVFGTGATLAGAFLGGIILLKLGINRSLWIFGVLQALSTACFAILARIGYSIPALSGVIAFENLSSGMGTAAFVAFMASITNKKFTATQYALLTSLIGVPRAIASAVTGFLAKHIGWESFFFLCALVAIPGMLLLLKFAPWNSKAVVEVEAV
ncbi:MAG: AmpG family muropeptide MFS transporter [Deltaproteobacteria bacterium]|jgi:PAT family beta-lactamase induction signal transducer AmpG|nr:AmpG family muropeptide MFS transporter [Deltaproteobacteria bacterium]